MPFRLYTSQTQYTTKKRQRNKGSQSCYQLEISTGISTFVFISIVEETRNQRTDTRDCFILLVFTVHIDSAYNPSRRSIPQFVWGWTMWEAQPTRGAFSQFSYRNCKQWAQRKVYFPPFTTLMTALLLAQFIAPTCLNNDGHACEKVRGLTLWCSFHSKHPRSSQLWFTYNNTCSKSCNNSCNNN